jgi:hypothetical protein
MVNLKLIPIGLMILALAGCYNAAMMRATDESRQACQSDSDCPADYMCVFNISTDSALGECVDNANYDPWANRQLEDFIKLKEKQKQKDKKEWKPIQQNK